MDILPTGAFACFGRPPGTPCVCADGIRNGVCVRFGNGQVDCIPLQQQDASQSAQLGQSPPANCSVAFGPTAMVVMLAMLAAASVALWRRGQRAVRCTQCGRLACACTAVPS